MKEATIKEKQSSKKLMALVSGDELTQEKLEQSVEVLSLIFEESHELITVTNKNAKTLWANKSWLNVFGNIEKAINPFQSVHNDDIKKVQKAWRELLENNNPFRDLEYRFLMSDGSYKIFQTSAFSFVVDNKTRYCIFAHDITEGKTIELELIESEKRFSTLFKTSRDAIMTLEPPDWLFTSGNVATTEMFKAADEEDFCSRGPWEYSPEKQPDGRLSGDKAKEMIMKAMEEGSNFFEWDHKRLNGDVFPATVLLSRIELGNRSFLQATVRDITDEKRAEQQIRESHQEMNQIFNATTPMYVIGLDSVITRVNSRFCNMFQLNINNVLGSKCIDVWKGSHCFSEKCSLQKMKEVEQYYSYEANRELTDGTKLICNVENFPYKDDNGKLIGLIKTFTDITKIVKSSQFKTEFLATMSHELRTPLNAIIGFTDLLLEGTYGELNEEQLDFLNDIKSSAEHQFEMIKDILDISKIEAGQLSLKKSKFSLNTLIEQVNSTLKPLYLKKKLAFKVKGLDYEREIQGDPIRIKEILYNLLSNAIKFTLAGQVTFDIKENSKEYIFLVRDTGIGIAKKDFELMFKEFKRVDSPFVRSVPGTGLGLSLTKRLVELHGGEISFTSVLGKGTDFIFTIPKENN